MNNEEYLKQLMSKKRATANRYEDELVSQMLNADEEIGKVTEYIGKLHAELQRSEARKIALSAVLQQAGATLIKFRPPDDDVESTD